MGPAVRRPFVRPFWFPLTLLLVGSAATIFVTRELRQAFDEQDAERFASAANQLEDRINDRIETYIAMLPNVPEEVLEMVKAVDEPGWLADLIAFSPEFTSDQRQEIGLKTMPLRSTGSRPALRISV